jgi:hypothetical protein
MSKRWIVILLFVSLAFNLAVMVMFLHLTVFGKHLGFPPHFRPSTEFRDNNPRHIQRVTPRPEDMLVNKDEIRKLKDEFRQKRREFMETLRQENFSEEDALKAMEASRVAQDILEKRLGNSLIEFRKKLTAREAKEYFKPKEDRRNLAPGTDNPLPEQPKPDDNK